MIWPNARTEPAIISGNASVDGYTLTNRAESLGAVLRRKKPAGIVGVWAADAVDLATGVLGALAVPMQVFIIPETATQTEVLELCALESACAVVCDLVRADLLVGERHALPELGLMLVSLTRTGPRLRAAEPQNPSLHLYTSGTNGHPKGIIRSLPSLENEGRVISEHLGMRPGIRVLCAAPSSHLYGFSTGLLACLYSGATLVAASPRLAESLFRTLSLYEPEIVVAVPGQYAAWSNLRRSVKGQLPHRWISSAAPLPPDVRRSFECAWHSPIAEQYGMSECGAISVDLDGSRSLGHPYPGVRVWIDVYPGEDSKTGEIVVDTPYGATGYVRGEALGTPSPFTADGIRTGDTGWLDGDGRIHVAGRRTDQINVHGRKVSPAEVERALARVPGVCEVAVLGVDRADGSQWVAAFLACDDGLKETDLHRATSQLAAYKRPQRIIRVHSLPRSGTGKIQRHRLIQLLRSEDADG